MPTTNAGFSHQANPARKAGMGHHRPVQQPNSHHHRHKTVQRQQELPHRHQRRLPHHRQRRKKTLWTSTGGNTLNGRKPSATTTAGHLPRPTVDRQSRASTNTFSTDIASGLFPCSGGARATLPVFPFYKQQGRDGEIGVAKCRYLLIPVPDMGEQCLPRYFLISKLGGRLLAAESSKVCTSRLSTRA